jgi:hypothetical protein
MQKVNYRISYWESELGHIPNIRSPMNVYDIIFIVRNKIISNVN